MKKISKTSQDQIVHLLRNWTHGTSLTWEALRQKMAAATDVSLSDVWSRQSLSANDEVRTAFDITKRRLHENPAKQMYPEAGTQQYRISELELELEELQVRYDRLLLRHAQLAYNSSLLEGGSHLLDDPLPDNTQSQRGR